jgi:hypothetical protein
MATAALLHFNGSVADMVQWVGGPHVAQHRDVSKILKKLTAATNDAELIEDVRCPFTEGIPKKCNVSATEENYHAYFKYGNHSSVDAAPDKTYKAMVKDNKKGYTILFDKRLIP